MESIGSTDANRRDFNYLRIEKVIGLRIVFTVAQW